MSKENINKKSGGIVSGLLLLVVGIGILWYNEGRTVKNQGAINEARKNYIDVSSKEIESKNDGKLVSTKGKIDLSETTELSDSKFGIKAKAAKLIRTVEMYQWEEKCETDDDDRKRCTYEKVWESSIIDSSDFEESGHTNPNTMPYENEVYIADNVKLGAFYLPEELIKSLSTNKKKNNDDLTKEYNNSVESIKIDGSYLTDIKDGNAEIGNVRISYQYLDSENVSVMAVQNDNTFEAYTAKNGKDIYKIVKGNYTGAQILEKMTKSNNNWKWILRAIGVLITISAFSSMFSFINNLTSRIPILGNLVSGATGLISVILGLSLSLIVIAIAWFRFRPVLSIILIALVIALVVFLKFYVKKENK